MVLVLKPVHEFCCKVPTQQLATKSPDLGMRCQVCVCVCVLRQEHHSTAELPRSAVSAFPPLKGWVRGENRDRECPVQQAPPTGEGLFTGEMGASYWKSPAVGLLFIV